MKILIFAGYFYPHKGGYEDHIYQFSERLSKKGHKISIFTTNTNNSKKFEEINQNFDIYRIPVINALNGTYPIPIFNSEFFNIWNILKRQHWDLVMTRTRFFTTSFLGLVFAKINKTRLFHVEHGTCHTVSSNFIIRFINIIYDHTFGKLIIKSATNNIGNSREACKFLKHLGANNPSLIYRGIDSKIINKIRLRKEINNIIYVGRLIYAKGIQDLINAFSLLEDKGLKLTIVGNGPYREELEKLTKNLNLERRIKFVGEKERVNVLKLLAESDLFVSPSYSESVPTSVLEAGVVGLPVIATEVGGTREVIINKKTGLIVKEKSPSQIKQAIEFMISHKKERESYRNNLNKLIKEKFDCEEIIKQWEKLFKEIEK